MVLEFDKNYNLIDDFYLGDQKVILEKINSVKNQVTTKENSMKGIILAGEVHKALSIHYFNKQTIASCYDKPMIFTHCLF